MTDAIKLTKPLVRKNSTIDEVRITSAIEDAGVLRGLRLSDVLNFEFGATSTLLSRVTAPALTASEISKLHPLDFIQLSEALTPFLVPGGAIEPSEKVTVEA